jgi:hypothetical protein
MPMTEAAAHEPRRDTPAVVSLSRLTFAQRLCDYAECRKPLQTVLQCAKCKGVAYCSKDCQVFQYHHTLLAH